MCWERTSIFRARSIRIFSGCKRFVGEVTIVDNDIEM